MSGPLLEWVFYRSVGLDREDTWIEWYDYHHYMVMQMPGWTWARMYHALIGEEKYLALYRVEDYESLKQVYGWPDVEAGRTEVIEHQLHPALRADWEEKQKRGFADTGQFMFNGGARKDTGHWGWQQLAGSTFDDPFLTRQPASRHGDGQRPRGRRGAVERVVRQGALPGAPRTAGRGRRGLVRHHDGGLGRGAPLPLYDALRARGRSRRPRPRRPSRRGPEAKAFWEDPAAKPYYDLAGDVLIDYYQPISKHWSSRLPIWCSRRSRS